MIKNEAPVISNFAMTGSESDNMVFPENFVKRKDHPVDGSHDSFHTMKGLKYQLEKLKKKKKFRQIERVRKKLQKFRKRERGKLK